jgi:Uma2 family endonuclease
MIRNAITKISTDEYVQMHETGLIRENARVELLDGVIVPMSPIGSRHADMVELLDDLLRDALGKKYRYFVQNPLRLSDRSMPEPDVMVLQKKSYTKQLPTPAEGFLLIEVGDTSSADDRDEKLPLYAAERIPEVWLVDLNFRKIEQYSNPVGDAYLNFSQYALGQSIRSTNLPELSLDVNQLFDETNDS